MFGKNKIIALAVSDGRITAVEMGAEAGKKTIRHAAVLDFTVASDIRGDGSAIDARRIAAQNADTQKRGQAPFSDNENGTSPLSSSPSGPVSAPLSGALFSLDQPQALGKRLKALLAGNGMKATHCIVGLPASYLACREKSLPTADAAALKGALSLAAEREFASGDQELVFDYTATASPGGTSALLLAAPRRIVQQVSAVAKAAGLKVQGITSSSLALAMLDESGAARTDAGGTPALRAGETPATQPATQPGTPATQPGTPAAQSATQRLTLCLTGGGIEVVRQAGAAFCMIRHLPACLESPTARWNGLAGELRRIMVMSGSSSPAELAVWNQAGIGAESIDALARDLGVPVARRLVAAMPFEAAPGQARLPDDMAPFAQAAAVASLAGQELPVDFLHSRLAASGKFRLARPLIYAAVAAVVVLAAAAWFLADWRAEQQQVEQLQQQLAQVRQPLKDAKAVAEDVKLAGLWFDDRSVPLDVLLRITERFTQDGRIWATSLSVNDGSHISLKGRAGSDTAVLELRRALIASPVLADVNLTEQRQIDRTTREMAFAFNLTYSGGGK